MVEPKELLLVELVEQAEVFQEVTTTITTTTTTAEVVEAAAVEVAETTTTTIITTDNHKSIGIYWQNTIGLFKSILYLV